MAITEPHHVQWNPDSVKSVRGKKSAKVRISIKLRMTFVKGLCSGEIWKKCVKKSLGLGNSFLLLGLVDLDDDVEQVKEQQ